MFSRFHGKYMVFAVAVASAVMPATSHSLVLTSEGERLGFSLTLFLDEIPNTGFCCGPLGIATNHLGQVVLQNYKEKTNSVFNDVDGQKFADALSAAPFGANQYASALAYSGGNLYATQYDLGGVVVKLNADGSVNSNLTGTGAGGHGLWTNPVNGHLVSSTDAGINDIDPSTGLVTKIVANVNADGVSVSVDGSVVYGASNYRVYGWDYQTGSIVYESGNLGPIDGTAVIQGNTRFSGSVIANSNDGQVWLLDPVGGTAVVIANGGTRGDYVGLDNTNGTLFLTQTSEVYRLSCGAGCSFSAVVPEPGTWSFMIIGLIFLYPVTVRARRLRGTAV